MLTFQEQLERELPGLESPRRETALRQRGNGAARDSTYDNLLTAFREAYDRMNVASRSFSAVIADMPATLTDQERRSYTSTAAGAYEDAREEFNLASAILSQFLIAQLVSAKSR
jgi:hypothetical protein